MKTSLVVAAALALGLAAPRAIAQSPINCGGQPGIQHTNGIGQSWYDCTAAGTYNLTQAQQAANAWVQAGNAATVGNGSCSGYAAAVMAKTASSCAVWVYSKALAGRARVNTASNSCSCPTSTADPAWQ